MPSKCFSQEHTYFAGKLHEMSQMIWPVLVSAGCKRVYDDTFLGRSLVPANELGRALQTAAFSLPSFAAAVRECQPKLELITAVKTQVLNPNG